MYLFLKFLHVALSIALFGHIFASVYTLSLARRAKRSDLLGVLSIENRIGQRMGPLSLLVILSGVALAFMFHSFRPTWIWLSLVLYGGIVALGPGWVDPAIRRALSTGESDKVRSDTTDIQPHVARAFYGLLGMAIITIVIVGLMVYRPR